MFNFNAFLRIYSKNSIPYQNVGRPDPIEANAFDVSMYILQMS